MADKTPRFVNDPKIEAAFSDIMAAGRRHGLSDAEFIAVISNIVGRMIAAAPAGKDADTLRDTAAFNIKTGGAELAGVISGLRRMG